MSTKKCYLLFHEMTYCSAGYVIVHSDDAVRVVGLEAQKSTTVHITWLICNYLYILPLLYQLNIVYIEFCNCRLLTNKPFHQTIAKMARARSNNPPSLIQPWQQRALDNGRTPLPEAPGERPWLRSKPPSAPLSPQTPKTTKRAPANYKFWPEEEMRRLITLKKSGWTWDTLTKAFPDRTREAIRQAYHKRRHVVEKKMEIEAAEAEEEDDTDG